MKNMADMPILTARSGFSKRRETPMITEVISAPKPAKRKGDLSETYIIYFPPILGVDINRVMPGDKNIVTL